MLNVAIEQILGKMEIFIFLRKTSEKPPIQQLLNDRYVLNGVIFKPVSCPMIGLNSTVHSNFFLDQMRVGLISFILWCSSTVRVIRILVSCRVII